MQAVSRHGVLTHPTTLPDHYAQIFENHASASRTPLFRGALFGSSDYHGAGKPNRIGENTTDPQVIAEVIAQGAIEVIEP